MTLYIGTSGWTYPHWQNAFFPKELPSAERLHFYSQKFNSVEINTTFYGTPKKATVRAWREAVPRHFRFAIKASRFITHNKKLLEPRKSSIKLFRAIEPIADQTAAFLFQLPPWFAKDEARLKAFLKRMPSAHSYAFEFRHPSWFSEAVYDVLRGGGAALCIWDLKGSVSPLEVTSNQVYLRLHGPTTRAYRGSYPAATLRQWRDRIRKWRRAKKKILCYFDNDEKGFAPVNALKLAGMLGDKKA
jgi:uncharacterized protein YecE (DUF72 family)